MSGYVYRCYDAADQLIYIGSTSNIEKRMRVHRAHQRSRASAWLRACMVRYEVTEYDSRAAALDAERDAIAAEAPVLNTQGRREPLWMTRREAAEYLVENEHLELALETACTCWRETREAGGFDLWCAPHMEIGDTWRAAS